jgi:hypothetical protein
MRETEKTGLQPTDVSPTKRRVVGSVAATHRGRAVTRGGRWVPGLPVVDGREVRADQCLHDWRPVPGKERGTEACSQCPATCRRGEDDKIESYSAGLAAPERPAREWRQAAKAERLMAQQFASGVGPRKLADDEIVAGMRTVGIEVGS